MPESIHASDCRHQAPMSAAAIDLVQREISNPDTQWSLGTFGAIAEFSRDHRRAGYGSSSRRKAFRR